MCFKVCDKNVSQKLFYKYINHAIDDRALMALSSLLDSEASFAQQAEECELSEPWITLLKDNGVATFAKLSFAITSPGTVASDGQVTRFLNNMRPGVVATIADFAAFKRVLFESQTLMIHRFKSAAKGGDIVPKKMSAPEHDARLTRQRDQLLFFSVQRLHGFRQVVTQENKKANQKQHRKNRKKHTTKPEPNKDDREKWDRASARSTSSFGHHWTLGAGTWALRSLCTDG